jgi:hypothetical protein
MSMTDRNRGDGTEKQLRAEELPAWQHNLSSTTLNLLPRLTQDLTAAWRIALLPVLLAKGWKPKKGVQ